MFRRAQARRRNIRVAAYLRNRGNVRATRGPTMPQDNLRGETPPRRRARTIVMEDEDSYDEDPDEEFDEETHPSTANKAPRATTTRVLDFNSEDFENELFNRIDNVRESIIRDFDESEDPAVEIDEKFDRTISEVQREFDPEAPIDESNSQEELLRWFREPTQHARKQEMFVQIAIAFAAQKMISRYLN